MRPGPLAGPPSHFGLVVRDLATAMRDLGARTRWVAMEPAGVPVRSGPAGAPRSAWLRIAWACLGRLHCELIEAVDVEPWTGPGGLHHVGWWVADVGESSRLLEAAGLPLEACDATPDGPVHFAYHGLAGRRLEVSSARRGDHLRELCGAAARDLTAGVDLLAPLPVLTRGIAGVAAALGSAA